MAWRTGRWEYGSGNGMRVEMQVTRSSVYHSSTEVRYYVKIYTRNQYRYNDFQFLNLSGKFSGQIQYNNTSGSNSSGGGRVLRYSKTYTYNYPSNSYGRSPGKVSFGGRVTGAYNGVTPSVSGTWTIPARPYAAPARPDNVVLSRPNTRRLDLKWDRYASSARPYTSQEIRMREFTGDSWGGYRRIATVSGGATSYVLNSGVDSNTMFQMAIRSQNSAGHSAWRYSNVMGNYPHEPSQVRAKLNPDGASVSLSWVSEAYDPPSSLGAITFNIERRPGNSGSWTRIKTGHTSTSYTDNSADPGDNQYQIRTISSVDPGTHSSFVQSNVVSTIVPPLAPTQLSPDGQIVDLNDSQTLRWNHNDGGDGADQSHFSIEISTDSGTTWSPLVTNVSSSTTEYTIAGGSLPNDPTAYQWRVQTQGVTTEAFGPWSNSATFTGSTAPTVSITAPGPVTNFPPLTVEWTYSQAEGVPQSAALVQLLDDQGVVLEESLATGSSFTFGHRPSDATTYEMRVMAQSQLGLNSNIASTTTTIDFPEPSAVELDGVFGECDGTFVLSILALPPETGETDTDSVIVERRVENGEWVTLATGLPTRVDVSDPLPSMTGVTEYRVTSVSTIPSYRVNPVFSVTGPDGGWKSTAEHWGYLSYGDGFGTTVRVQDDLLPKASAVRARKVQPFLGRAKPVLMTGTNIDKTVAISGSLFWREECPVDEECEYSSTPREWEAAGLEATIVCWRDHFGRRIFGSLSEVSVDYNTMMSAGLSFKVTEADYTEVYEEDV